nr:hypothetical protein Itr_chr02CG17510 [Ipomoea trifida]
MHKLMIGQKPTFIPLYALYSIYFNSHPHLSSTSSFRNSRIIHLIQKNHMHPVVCFQFSIYPQAHLL